MLFKDTALCILGFKCRIYGLNSWTHVFHVMKMDQHQKTISILDRPFLKRSLGFRFWVDLQLRRALYTKYPCNHPVNNPYLALCQGTSPTWLPTCIQALHLSIFYHRTVAATVAGVPVPRQIQSRAGPLRGSRENRAGRRLRFRRFHRIGEADESKKKV